MSKVIKGNLVDANNSQGLTVLEEIIEMSNDVKISLEEFINSSKNNFKGSAYDAARSKLQLYVEALNKQITLCDILINNIHAANNQMINYMEEYNFLDSGYLDGYKNEINSIKNKISSLSVPTQDDDMTDAEFNEKMSEYNSSINYYIGRIAELEKLCKKLEGLDAADSSAWGIISNNPDGNSEDIINYSKAVKGLEAVNIK